MRLLILIAVCGLLTLVDAQEEFSPPEYCIAHYKNRGAIAVGEATLSGAELSFELSDGNMWTVPFSIITVELPGHNPMSWSSETTEPRALMDWIETALSLQALSDINPFAIQDADGRIWLVSIFFYECEEQCFAHLLNLL